MHRSTRRLVLFVVILIPCIASLALVYQAGMYFLEGESREYWPSLMTVVETLTTTGYGADSQWDHPFMNLFIIMVQVMGVLIFFLIFPIYLIPFMEERFEARLPTRTTRLHDHILIYNYDPAVQSLVEELKSYEIPYIIIEEQESDARWLVDAGFRILHRKLEDGSLEAGNLLHARALVANGLDDQNADIILAARQLGFEGEILALAEEANHRQPLLFAGATAVFDPRHILAAILAARASQKISPTLTGAQHIGRNLEVWEIRVQPGSPLEGKTLADLRLGTGTGVNIIGHWVGGRLVPAPGASSTIMKHSILVAVGSRENMEKLQEMAGPARPLHREGPFLICGFGEVGKKVVELLRDAGEEVRVMDRIPKEGVDIVGDVLDPSLLPTDTLSQTQAAILALDSDSATLFATVILRNTSADLPIIARVNRADNIQKIHRAGADYALSMSGIAGQMLARRLLGEESISVDPQLKILRVHSDVLDGKRAGDLDIRGRTGCSIVAVERGDETVLDLDGEFVFQPSDAVYVVGNGETLKRFHETYPPPAG